MSQPKSKATDSLKLPAMMPPTISAPLPRRQWLQFSLRTLLGVMLLAALFLGWWFRPFVVETRRDDGSVRTRFELRRDWRGRTVSHGLQAWYLRDGTRFTKTDYGTLLGPDEFGSLLMPENDFNSPAMLWFYQDNDLSLIVGGGQFVEPDEVPAKVGFFRPDVRSIDELQNAEESNE